MRRTGARHGLRAKLSSLAAGVGLAWGALIVEGSARAHHGPVSTSSATSPGPMRSVGLGAPLWSLGGRRVVGWSLGTTVAASPAARDGGPGWVQSEARLQGLAMVGSRLVLGASVPLVDRVELRSAETDSRTERVGLGDAEAHFALELLSPERRADGHQLWLGAELGLPTRSFRSEPEPGRRWALGLGAVYLRRFESAFVSGGARVAADTTRAGEALDLGVDVSGGWLGRSGARMSALAALDMRAAAWCSNPGDNARSFCREGRVTELAARTWRPRPSLGVEVGGSGAFAGSRPRPDGASWSAGVAARVGLGPWRDFDLGASFTTRISF